jgi:ATP-dependent exoDNAse (exonuclease V) beta subunit
MATGLRLIGGALSDISATVGKRIHAELAFWFNHGQRQSKTAPLDEDELVKLYISRADKIIQQWSGRETATLIGIVERRLWARYNSTFYFSGQPDLIYIIGKKALIVDWKTGWLEQPEAASHLSSALTPSWLVFMLTSMRCVSA